MDKCKQPCVAYSGNSTNLTRHLSQHHPRENAVLLGHSPVQTQPITSFITPKKMSLTDPKSKRITASIVKMIVTDLRPANVVEGLGFVDLMATTAPEYPLAKAEYYSQKVRDLYATKAALLKTKLESVRHLAITTDLWTSIAHHAYMGVTGHYVDDAGTLQSCLLDCVELPADEHSAADIASALQDRFEFWGLVQDGNCKVFAGVCDNGANVMKALCEHLQLPFVLGCFSHTVNLAVESGFKGRQVSPILAKARHVVEFFTRSSKATYQLREEQLRSGTAPNDVRELVRDVPTRWTSAYDSLRRLLQLKDPVITVLKNNGRMDLVLQPTAIYQLTALTEALEPPCRFEFIR